jgi:hypothetical protein
LRHLKPDFKTIADFRRDNHAAFRAVFREFVLLCRQLDLFGRELLAVDGTRIKAVNNKDRNFTRASLRQYIEGSWRAAKPVMVRVALLSRSYARLVPIRNGVSIIIVKR